MTIEIIDSIKRKVNLTIDKESIQKLTQTELKKYAKEAKIPGFRPGKIPQAKLEQLYGGRAYEDALNKELNQRFSTLVVQEKLDIVGEPKFNLTTSEGDEFIFEITFEVMPEVKLADISEKSIELISCELSEEDIDTTIDILKKQRATYNEVSDKGASKDDKVVIDFSGSVDGVKFEGGSANDYEFILGNGTMLPDFESGVLGMQVKETKTIEVNFPDNYNSVELKGKTAQFDITLKKLMTPILPELNSEFIISIGVADGNLDTLRKDIKDNLSKEVERRIQMKSRESVLNVLYEANPLEVPGSLVHDEIHHMMDRTKDNMLKQGYPEDKIQLTHDMFKTDAKRIVSLRILISQLIKDHSIAISEDDTRAIVLDMASMYNDPEEYMKWFYSDQNNVNNARNSAMEAKVVEFIKSQLKVTTTTLSYSELMKQST